MQYEELMAAKADQETPKPTERDSDTSFSLSNFVSNMFGFGKGSA